MIYTRLKLPCHKRIIQIIFHEDAEQYPTIDLYLFIFSLGMELFAF